MHRPDAAAVIREATETMRRANETLSRVLENGRLLLAHIEANRQRTAGQVEQTPAADGLPT